MSSTNNNEELLARLDAAIAERQRLVEQLQQMNQQSQEQNERRKLWGSK